MTRRVVACGLQAGGRRVVRVGDKEVDWDSGFRLYLVTHLAAPAFSPEVGGKTTLISFSVTEQARRRHSKHAGTAPPLGPSCSSASALLEKTSGAVVLQ